MHVNNRQQAFSQAMLTSKSAKGGTCMGNCFINKKNQRILSCITSTALLMTLLFSLNNRANATFNDDSELVNELARDGGGKLNAVQATSDEVKLDSEHFPDENFRSYIKQLASLRYHVPLNDGDVIPPKVLTSDNYFDFRRINTAIEPSSYNHATFNELISNFKGIEYFTGLKTLLVSDYQGAELDLSKNTKLTELILHNPRNLTKLTLGQKPDLTKLVINTHNAAIENVQKYPNTQDYRLPLAEIDLTACPQIHALDLSNTSIRQLNLAETTLLLTLYLENTAISDLDLSQHIYLKQLNINKTNITSLDLKESQQLKELHAENAKLKYLDISNSKELELLNVNNNELRRLNLRDYSQLKLLWCVNNPLLSLDVPKHEDLLLNTKKRTVTQNYNTGENIHVYSFQHDYKESVIFARLNPETNKYEAKLKDIFTDAELAQLVKYSDDIYFKAAKGDVFKSYFEYDAARQTLVMHNAQAQNPAQDVTIEYLYQTGRYISDELKASSTSNKYAKQGIETFKFKVINVGKINSLIDKVLVADLDQLQESEKKELTTRILENNQHIKPYAKVTYEQNRKVKFSFQDGSSELVDLENFAQIDTVKQFDFHKKKAADEIGKLQYLSNERKDKWLQMLMPLTDLAKINQLVDVAKKQDIAVKEIVDLESANSLSATQKQFFVQAIENEDEQDKFIAKVNEAKALISAMTKAKQAVQAKISELTTEIAKQEYNATQEEQNLIIAAMQQKAQDFNAELALLTSKDAVLQLQTKVLNELEKELTKFKQSQTNKKKLNEAKLQAKAAIETAQTEKNKEINEHKIATDKERQIAKDSLTTTVKTALTEIEQASELTQIEQIKNNAITTIKNITVQSTILANVLKDIDAKKQAKETELAQISKKIPTYEEIEQAKQALADLYTSIKESLMHVNDMHSLTNYKQGALASFDLLKFGFKVREEVKATIKALKYLDQATKDKYTKLVDNLDYDVNTGNNLVMWRIEAVAKILDAQMNRYDFVDKDTNPDATQEEKAEFKQKVDQQKDTEVALIQQTTSTTVKKQGDTSVQTIINMQPTYKHKEQLRQDLQTKVDAKKKEVNGASITSTSKQYWLGEVEKIQKEANELLKNPNLTKEQANTINDAAKAKIDALEIKEIAAPEIADKDERQPEIEYVPSATNEADYYLRGHRFKPMASKTGEAADAGLGIYLLLAISVILLRQKVNKGMSPFF